MQIFVPYANPKKTAKCLDNKRLNKQILECIQIISTNIDIFIGWKIPKYVKNHPNTKLWNNTQYNFYLIEYLYQLLMEYEYRKNKQHSCWCQYVILYKEILTLSFISTKIKHLNSEFCKSHQKRLLEKDFGHYKKFFI